MSDEAKDEATAMRPQTMALVCPACRYTELRTLNPERLYLLSSEEAR